MNESYGEVLETALNKAHPPTGMENDEDNLVLWVGNLDSRATENMVYELFCQAGPIQCIRLPKSPDGQGHKGYCFVTFQHESSVPYSINVMEGTTLFGKKLKLQPRPGSIHRKLMDQKKAELQHHQQQPLPQQQQQHIQPQQQQAQQLQQQQWFAHPQLAQVPPNMFLYQNQLYQSFSPTPNMNMNVMAIPLQTSPMGTTQYVQMPLQPQQQTHQVSTTLQQQHAPQQQQPRGNYGVHAPRTPTVALQNGFAAPQQQPQYGGMSQQPLRATSPQQQQQHQGNPSHYNNHPQQGMNGQQQPYHQQQQTRPYRGSRPQRNGYANGSIVNNNSNRMPFQHHQQQRMPPPQQQQQQPPQQQQQQGYMVSPMYQGQTVQLVQSPQDFRRGGNPPQSQQQGLPPGTIPGGPNYGSPSVPNGYPNVHLYHY